MERVTVRHLMAKIEYLKTLGVHLYLDHHQPGGNKYVWAIEIIDPSKDYGSGRRLYSSRMTTVECSCFLAGMISGIEERARAKQFT